MTENTVKITVDGVEFSVSQKTADQALEMLGQVVDPALETFGIISNLARIVNQPLRHRYEKKELEHRFSMQQRVNQMEILSRAKEVCETRQVVPHELHQKFLIPYLDGASMEDDPDIREMWSELLVAEISNSGSENIRVIDILKRLNGESARFLRTLYSYGRRLSDNSRDFTWEGRFENLYGSDSRDAVKNNYASANEAGDVRELVNYLNSEAADLRIGYMVALHIVLDEVQSADVLSDPASQVLWRCEINLEVVDYLAADGLIVDENLFVPSFATEDETNVELVVRMVCLSPAGERFISRVMGAVNVQ